MCLQNVSAKNIASVDYSSINVCNVIEMHVGDVAMDDDKCAVHVKWIHAIVMPCSMFALEHTKVL